jgi:nicotinamide-nucleotide amidase
MTIRTVSVITIGDELLIGQTIDTNGAWMGQLLTQEGVSIIERATITDDKEQIINTIRRLQETSDLILITGGLGPTRDDVTKVALAEVAGVEMVFDQEMWVGMQGFFAELNRSTTDAHQQQCYMPAGITKLENRMGTAPGMLFDLEDTYIISMPGVPYEMKYIMEHGVLPIIKDHRVGAVVHRTIHTIGEGESRIAVQIDDIITSMPAHVSLAFLPSLGSVRLRVTAIGDDDASLRLEVDHYAERIIDTLGEIVFGEGDTNISKAVGALCKAKGIMIGTAESCTGGKTASKLVEVAGSSAYFGGSTVTYTNELKRDLLGVAEQTLAEHGAVSEATVKEMVTGAIPLLGVDVAVAISGIAGPSGGSADKPVGTIWLAVGNKDSIFTKKLNGRTDRSKNIEYASNIALDMIRRFVLKHY